MMVVHTVVAPEQDSDKEQILCQVDVVPVRYDNLEFAPEVCKRVVLELKYFVVEQEGYKAEALSAEQDCFEQEEYYF